MTKSELVATVAEAHTDLTRKHAELVVNTIFDSMKDALSEGDRIEIRGFGSFQVKIREARDGRNPKTGEPVHISAKRTPFFKVGKELKEMVDELDPNAMTAVLAPVTHIFIGAARRGEGARQQWPAAHRYLEGRRLCRSALSRRSPTRAQRRHSAGAGGREQLRRRCCGGRWRTGGGGSVMGVGSAARRV